MKALFTVLLLIMSNTFMTLAWYGHLKFQNYPIAHKIGLMGIILISWGLALFEYLFQVPANRIGFQGNGGPFTLFQLKIIQEVITLIVFTIIALLIFKTVEFKWNYLVSFIFIVFAVYFAFK